MSAATSANEVWARFDTAMSVIGQGRSAGIVPEPSARLLEEPEALGAAMVGSASVEVVAMSGASILRLELEVGTLVSELRQAVADTSGQTLAFVQLVHDGKEMQPEQPLFAHGVRSGSAAQITLVVRTMPLADHHWDFRGGGLVVLEKGGKLAARLRNGAHCTNEGVVFDGVGSHVVLDTWEWGGPTSFEILVKYDQLRSNQVLFDIGCGGSDEIVALWGYTRFEVFEGRQNMPAHTDPATDGSGTFRTGEWVHFVASTANTATGQIMSLYRDGRLVASCPQGGLPKVITRPLACLGKACWGDTLYLHGTIAFFRMWHGLALDVDQANTLYAEAVTNA